MTVLCEERSQRRSEGFCVLGATCRDDGEEAIFNMPLLDRLLKQGLVRTNSNGAFPVTEEDIRNYQIEQAQAQILQEDKRAGSELSSSSCNSQEDNIVLVRAGEEVVEASTQGGDKVKTPVLRKRASHYDQMEGVVNRCPFDMSLLLRARRREQRAPDGDDGSLEDFVDTIEFTDDNASQGDNVLLLKRTRKKSGSSVKNKARQVMIQPLRSGLRFFESIGERVAIFQRNHLDGSSKLWNRRRYLDRTASMDQSEEELLEFDQSSSSELSFVGADNFDNAASEPSDT